MALGGKPSLNSNKLHIGYISKIASKTPETKLNCSEESEIRLNSKDIYSQTGFCEKNMLSPDTAASVGSATGEIAGERLQKKRMRVKNRCKKTDRIKGF